MKRPSHEDEIIETDFLVIGTGAAGAIAAKRLSENGATVLLVEEGKALDTPEFRNDVLTGLKSMWRNDGMQFSRGKSLIPLLQGRCVGGSTTINGAIIHRMPKKILTSWQVFYDCSSEISYEHLESIWEKIEADLHIAPTPPDTMGKNSLKLAEAVKAMNYQGNAIKRNVKNCQKSSRCLQGCPHGAKQSMQRSYIPQALEGGAQLLTDCKALRILFHNEVASGCEVLIKSQENPHQRIKKHIKANKAILLAAGAIQTTGILQKSGLKKRLPKLGKGFQMHPGTAVLGEFDEEIDLFSGATQGYESLHFWNQRYKLETISLPKELLALRIPGIGEIYQNRLKSINQLASFALQLRARARGEIRTPFWSHTPQVYYNLTKEDLLTLNDGIKTLCQLMFAAGAKAVYPGIHEIPPVIHSCEELLHLDTLPLNVQRYHLIATHLFGGAIMGKSPETSVVDSYGKVHGINNLFVIDSACFPSSIGVNPQHTIQAFAWLFTEHLLKTFQ